MREKRCSWRDVRVWLKEHDWKSCIRHKRIWGSNPHLSASDFSKAPVLGAFFFNGPLCGRYIFWKGGRAAECGGLENRFTGTPGNEGSNPSPSARVLRVCLRQTLFRVKRDDAARAPGGTAGGPSGLDVRSTPGARFHGICTRQLPARCFVQYQGFANALSGVLFEIASLFKQVLAVLIPSMQLVWASGTVTCSFNLLVLFLAVCDTVHCTCFYVGKCSEAHFPCSPRALLVCFLVSRLKLPSHTTVRGLL